MVYLQSNQLWLTGKKLFVKWEETVDRKVIDCEFVEENAKDTCDYKRFVYIPGEPILTNGTERYFQSTKARKESINNFLIYTCDFLQKFRAISNHGNDNGEDFFQDRIKTHMNRRHLP